VSLAIGACDGGGGPGKTAPADGSPVDAAAPASDLGSPVDAPARPDVAADLPPLPPASLRLWLPGKARLAGGSNACSNGLPAGAADVWCAFTQTIASGDAGARTELWVINGTRAAAGENIPCDGTSADCKRLHPDLWTGGALGGPIFPNDDRFEGDTLIFYAGGISTRPEGIYQGPVWAWRPGWAEPRVISSDKGLFCFGHARAAVAYCVENVVQGPPIQFDLRAGTLVDAPQSQLPLIASGVRPWNGNEIAWHAEFSPDGTQFAISVQEPSTEGEVLHVGPTAELGKKALKEIAYKATYWRISLDGKRIYYLQEFGGTPVPAGKLVMADFPAGTNAVTLGTGVARYLLLGEPGLVDRGVGLFQDMQGLRGTFRVIADRDRPSQVVTVAERVVEVYPSPDGRYALHMVPDDQGIERMHLARTDGQGTCVLNADSKHDAFSLHFLERSDLIFWSEIEDENAAEPPAVGYVAATAGCGNRQRYAGDVDWVFTVKDRIAVLAHAPEGTFHYTLEHATVGAGASPLSAPTLIRAGTDGYVAPLSDGRSTRLLFQVPEGEAEGVYMYGPLPH
jgi:hypothetical protein